MPANKVNINESKQLERYIAALKDLKLECDRTIPIKTSHFCIDHKVHTSFFSFCVSYGVIEKVMAGKPKEGSLFEWTHKPASNEQPSTLAVRILQRVRKYQSDMDAKKKDPKHLAKQHDKKQKKEEAATSVKGAKGAINREAAIIKYLLEPVKRSVEAKQQALRQAQQEHDQALQYLITMEKELGIR